MIRPVRDPILGFRDMVATRRVELVRHAKPSKTEPNPCRLPLDGSMHQNPLHGVQPVPRVLSVVWSNDVWEFDDNRTWGALLTATIGDLLSESVVEKLVSAAPEYVEDARDLLFSCTDRERIVDAALAWIRLTTVAGYHGSRLIDSELDSIRACGLLPLDANARRARLARALSSHSRWNQVADRLDSTLHEYGVGGRAGCRQGQVHLTLSRCGLVNGFNHYLTFGSEFDQQVAQVLLADDGKELLRKNGRARVIRVAVPGEVALEAVNRYFTVDQRLARGEVPGLVDDVLKVWSYGFAHPDFDCGTLKIDCGMVFPSTVPPGWIVATDTLSI